MAPRNRGAIGAQAEAMETFRGDLNDVRGGARKSNRLSEPFDAAESHRAPGADEQVRRLAENNLAAAENLCRIRSRESASGIHKTDAIDLSGRESVTKNDAVQSAAVHRPVPVRNRQRRRRVPGVRVGAAERHDGGALREIDD